MHLCARVFHICSHALVCDRTFCPASAALCNLLFKLMAMPVYCTGLQPSVRLRWTAKSDRQSKLDEERSKLSQWQQELDGDESDEEDVVEATVRRLDLSWGCFAQTRVIHFCMGAAGQQCSYSRLRACTKHVQSLVHPAVFWRSA
jgi:hypothetical protein